MKYIYLHGFTSGPTSLKATYLAQEFAKLGKELLVLDLNMGNFTDITITKQLEYIKSVIGNDDVCLIGASMGGLKSAMLAKQLPQIKKIMLLAPAFGVRDAWRKQINELSLRFWRFIGQIKVPHSEYQKSVPLKYNFLEDMLTHEDRNIHPSVPTMIIHGTRDEVIPVEHSIHYNQMFPESKLFLIDSDHNLEKDVGFIWDKVKEFFELSN